MNVHLSFFDSGYWWGEVGKIPSGKITKFSEQTDLGPIFGCTIIRRTSNPECDTRFGARATYLDLERLHW